VKSSKEKEQREKEKKRYKIEENLEGKKVGTKQKEIEPANQGKLFKSRFGHYPEAVYVDQNGQTCTR
jgi:hypothetical protein